MNVVIGALGWKSFYRIGFIVDAVALQTLDGTRERAASFPGVHRSDLDVPLLPLRETHAVFQFFDGAGEPLSELTARFESGGDEIEATTDAFGEIFLDASENQTYTFIDAVPADERLAVSAAEFSRPTSSVA